MPEPEKLVVHVCRGVTCTHHFADDVYREFRRQVTRLGLAHVTVARGGCYDRCGGGVTVMVRAGGLPSEAMGPGGVGAAPDGVCYPEVMEPDVRRIAVEHLRDGVPISALQVALRGAKTPPS